MLTIFLILSYIISPTFPQTMVHFSRILPDSTFRQVSSFLYWFKLTKWKYQPIVSITACTWVQSCSVIPTVQYPHIYGDICSTMHNFTWISTEWWWWCVDFNRPVCSECGELTSFLSVYFLNITHTSWVGEPLLGPMNFVVDGIQHVFFW